MRKFMQYERYENTKLINGILKLKIDSPTLQHSPKGEADAWSAYSWIRACAACQPVSSSLASVRCPYALTAPSDS